MSDDSFPWLSSTKALACNAVQIKMLGGHVLNDSENKFQNGSSGASEVVPKDDISEGSEVVPKNDISEGSEDLLVHQSHCCR